MRLKKPYYEWSVNFINDDIHARKANNFVKLISPFVDASIARHE